HNEKKIYFKYSPGFIEKGIQISPFKMPLSDKILTAEIGFFDGLFGVFNDSLPDGWGRLLLDRSLLAGGISPGQIGPLERLAYVGRGGMGALMYRPAITSGLEAGNIADMDDIAKQVKQVLEGNSTDVIDELYKLGGSSGGARPKILVGYNPKTDHLIADAENLPEGYEHWIIKFPSSSDPNDIANVEYAYSKMAMDAGIEMNTCKLFRGRSGIAYFGTRRFDREKGKRLHMHSASGLMHDNFRLSNMDYGHLMDCTFRLEKHVIAYEKILRLASLNVFAYNRDDHSKNISFLMDHKGHWRLAPAYDLTFSFTSHGMHSTMVDGEGKDPGKAQLLSLAEQFGVKNPNIIIDEVRDVVSNWKKYANESGMGVESRQLIGKVIE
ncbi:MAG: type II toxin-antitoxin system HipA family toxin, partial [Bacteroidales bacterium]|nr:type II toxin-antitoxin system HipA family toxin [Bacteroidales bacterium]